VKENVTPPGRCPGCRYQFDRASSLAGEHEPSADDFTLCLKCGAILRFNADLTIREASPADLETLDLETYEEIQRIRSAIVRMSIEGGRS
jgi:hypothetical protein